MTAVRDLRFRAQILLIVLLIVDAAAIVMLASPLGGSRAAKLQEDERVRRQWQDEMHKALPVRDIDKKIQEARSQVGAFYQNRLPSRPSAVALELGRVAGENGVRLANVHYTPDDTAVEGLRRMVMDASLSGDYLKVVKFINALERDKMFFIVDAITLGDQQGGGVALHLQFETYLRETETPGTKS